MKTIKEYWPFFLGYSIGMLLGIPNGYNHLVWWVSQGIGVILLLGVLKLISKFK